MVGIPDEDLGRRLHAVVRQEKEIPAEELKTFLRKYLTPYKIPKTFEFVRSIRKGETMERPTEADPGRLYCPRYDSINAKINYIKEE